MVSSYTDSIDEHENTLLVPCCCGFFLALEIPQAMVRPHIVQMRANAIQQVTPFLR